MSVANIVTGTIQQVTPEESIPVTTTLTIGDSGGGSTTATRTITKSTLAGCNHLDQHDDDY
jgi:hypothetical protein